MPSPGVEAVEGAAVPDVLGRAAWSAPGWEEDVERVSPVVRAGVDVLAVVVACGSACYLAPIEYAAGRWLGLPPAQAWTITAAVEGLTLAALLAGRLAGGLLPTALVLTWVSALVGTLHSAAEEATRHGRALDVQAAASAALVCVLMVLAPALMHRLRLRVQRACQAGVHRIRQRVEQAEREAAERAAAERAAEREAAERQAAAVRAHELQVQRARAFAEQEQARLRLDHARADQARAEAERARADAERVRAQAERAAEQERAATERQRAAAEQARLDAERRQAQAEQERAAAERQRASLRGDRELARAHWADREAGGTPMTVAEIAELLAVTESRARAVVADWRRRTTVATGSAPRSAPSSPPLEGAQP